MRDDDKTVYRHMTPRKASATKRTLRMAKPPSKYTTGGGNQNKVRHTKPTLPRVSILDDGDEK